ncbi:M42 family peptidase [bacterium]|nr:M42 family peptidase [bacterium]
MDHELFTRVCNAPGVPGYEDEAQEVAMEVLGSCCDEVRRDFVGNVIALKRSAQPPADGQRAPRIVLAAHVDEIGMMVRHISDEGFIRFNPMGGLNPQVLISQRVLIHGKTPTKGVIVPPGGEGFKDKVPKVDDLFIDTGLPKDTLCERIEVGDIVTFAPEVEQLNDKVYVGRNFDDRLGTYCLLDAMRRVGDTVADVYAVSSVQEEVGLRGMRPAAYAIDADIGLAIDGSMAWGPYIGKHQRLCTLGEGAGIYIMDGLTIGNRKLVRYLFDLCEKFGIAYQKNIGGGTDAAAIQQSRGGAMSTTVGAPTRYMHSTVQLAHADDIDATAELLKAFAEHAHELLADG